MIDANLADGVQRRSVALNPQAWSEIDTAIPDVIEVLDDVRDALAELADHKDLDRPSVNATLRLIARAVDSLKEKEVRVLRQLDHAIRAASPFRVSTKGGQS